MINKLIILLAVVSAFIISGCASSSDVTSLVKTIPEVQAFLDDNPNVDI